jgi:hypothetical protein
MLRTGSKENKIVTQYTPKLLLGDRVMGLRMGLFSFLSLNIGFGR